jgi:hypothetical protein
MDAAFQSEKEEREKDNEIISQITSVPKPGHSERELVGLGMRSSFVWIFVLCFFSF